MVGRLGLGMVAGGESLGGREVDRGRGVARVDGPGSPPAPPSAAKVGTGAPAKTLTALAEALALSSATR